MFKRSTLSLIMCLAFPAAANSQDISEEGIARSVSLFSAFISHCQKSYFINVEEAKKYQRAFVNTGEKAFGKNKFSKLLAKEMTRRNKEVALTGATQWCAYQKKYMQQVDDGKLLQKSPSAKFSYTVDEMATIVAALVIAQDACGLRTNDVSLNSVLAKRGFNLKAFLPDGAHALLVETKIRKAKEFLGELGWQKACEGFAGAVREHLPEVVLN